VIFQLRLLKLYLFFGLIFSQYSHAHSIDERYDLPLPLNFFIFGSALVVLISFIGVLLVFTKPSIQTRFPIVLLSNLNNHFLLKISKLTFQISSVVIFFVVIGACFWGDANPLQNLAPNFIWMTWWLGLSLFISIFGNIWPLLNPWLNIYQFIQQLISTPKPKVIPIPTPIFSWNSLFFATLFLFVWSWLEVVYPVAFVPYRIGYLILIWSCISFLGIFLVGKNRWLQHVDFFSIYFNYLGNFSLFTYSSSQKALLLRPWGMGLIKSNSEQSPSGQAGFIIAMLTTVLFDGLYGNQLWLFFEKPFEKLIPKSMDMNGYWIGTIGLLFTWCMFYLIYQLTCYLSKKMCRSVNVKHLANDLAPSLIPIAIAYLIAHNFSSFMIQVQNIIFLISDPFNLGWDLFQTKNFRPNIALIDASFTWYLAVGSIVIGHILAILICHLIILQKTSSKKEVFYLSMPMTITMILLTMMSLIIIAEPMANSA
jgi:hypothetical protein